MNGIIEVDHLSKRFGELKAVDDLSFMVRKGEVYGFLGQNGAGKSTTIRMLLSLIRPSGGSIQIFGKNLSHHRTAILRQIGAIIEKPDLYRYLTALQNLEMMARLSGVVPGTAALMRQLERVGIAERANSKVKTFSQGMKQRLGIACSLIHDPPLIMLDEPINGLDPQGIADIRNLILHLSKNEGRTIFVSSHLLAEMELIADSMLIIDRGRKVAEGKVSELLNPADTLVAVSTGDDIAARTIIFSSAWAPFLQQSESLLIRMHKSKVSQFARFLVDNGVAIESLHPRHSLEQYFLSLTSTNQHVDTYRH